jgi:hypothetical protein
MTISADADHQPVSATEIAVLLAWARSLSETGPAADPAERAAYQAAKTALLTRIADHQHQRSPQLSTKDIV